MVGKKSIFFTIVFFIVLLSIDVHGFWGDKKVDEGKPVTTLSDKPSFIQRKHFRQGTCYQFTVYENGFWVGSAFETAALAIAALAHTGTKFEGFKVSVFKPKIWDFGLRWGLFITGYQLCQLATKNYQLAARNYELESKHKQSHEPEQHDPYNPNDPNFFRARTSWGKK